MRRFLPAALALLTFAVLDADMARAQITLVPGPQRLLALAPRYIAAADFNKDQFEDVVVTNSTSAKVSVLFGQDGQSFGTAVDLSVGRVLRGIAAADLNQDGNPDIAVVDFFDGRVFVVPGTGDGRFGQPVSFKVGLRPNDVAIGNFDRQKGNDLVTVQQVLNKVTVLTNIGANRGFQTLGQFPVGKTPKRGDVADLNGDGFDDIIAVNTGSGAADDISILLNTGVGSFRQPTNFVVGAGAKDVTVGDFNNDGVPDLAVLNAGLTSVANEFSVSILINRTEVRDGNVVGTGFFDVGTPVRISCPLTLGGISIRCTPNFMAVGDLDNDTNIDFAVTFFTLPQAGGGTQTAGLISAYAGHGDGTFDLSTQISVGLNPTGIVAGDFNGDGVTDLAIAETGTRTVRIINSLPPPKKTPGQGPCTFGRQCTTGSCVDNVCCNTATCPAGQFCNIPGSGGTCAAPVPVGSPCTLEQQCDSAFCVDGFCCENRECPSGQFCNSGICGPPADNGIPCNNNDQCASASCVDGFCCASDRCPAHESCNIPGFEGQCTAKFPEGQPCTDAAQCDTTFCVDGFCCGVPNCPLNQSCAIPGREGICFTKPTPTPTPTVTPTPAANGVSCTSGGQCISANCVDGVCCGSPSCPTGQSCNITGHRGVCANRLNPGDVCTGDQECLSSNCQSGNPSTCQGTRTPTPTPSPTPLQGGDPCTNTAQCRSALVCSTDTPRVCCSSLSCASGQSCNVPGHEGTCFNLPTPTPTQKQIGGDCAGGAECTTGNCTDGTCCDAANCPTGERCDIPGFAGQCAPPLGAGEECIKNTDCEDPLLCQFDPTSSTSFRCGIPFTPTPTLIPTAVTPGGCAPNEILIDGVCTQIIEHRSGGCSINERPDAGAVWLFAALPVGLWFRRRRALQRVAVRAYARNRR